MHLFILNSWQSMNYSMSPISLVLLLITLCLSSASNMQIRLTVPENCGPNHLIGNIKSNNFPPQYQSISMPDVFKLSPSTGDLVTRINLDREHTSTSRFQFLVISLTNVMRMTVTVILVDENDNSPKFNVSSLVINLSENYRPPYKQHLTSVFDADSDKFGVQRIEITSGNFGSTFALDIYKDKGDSRRSYLRLVLLRPMDYEALQGYHLVITAYDGGSPPRTAKLSVHIRVTNANDNVPTFDISRYLARVPEDLPVGSFVLQVNAIDRDHGIGDRIIYSIINNTKNAAMFSIDRYTGRIMLDQSLDYETQKQHEFTVEALDSPHEGGRKGSVRVVVEVSNVNDNPPEINVIWIVSAPDPITGEIKVPENATVGFLLARVTATDVDTIEEDKIILTLSSSPSQLFFLRQTSARSADLQVASPLTAKPNPVSLTITASDSGLRKLTTNQTFFLRIIDVNDHPPVFSSAFYAARLSIQAPLHSHILTLTAQDRDSGKNGHVTYFLLKTSEMSEWFTIDSRTGVLTNRIVPSSDLCGQVSLTVQARDGGQPPLMTNTTVQIAITGENLHTPEFQKPYQFLNLPSEIPVGACFHQVSAHDLDCGAVVTYSLAASTRPSPFRVEIGSGRVCVTKRLDAESNPNRFQLFIEGKDQSGSGSISVLDITIEHKLEDPIPEQSSDPPKFLQEKINLFVSESTPNNVTIFEFFTPGSRLSQFSLTSPSSLFSLDAFSGSLRLIGQLDHEVLTNHAISVIATNDKGKSRCEVSINVLDANDHGPVCSNTKYVIVVKDSAGPGTSIFNLSCTDKDSGINSQLSFTLLSVDVISSLVSGPVTRKRIKASRWPICIERQGHVMVREGASGEMPLKEMGLGGVKLEGRVEVRDGGRPTRSLMIKVILDVQLVHTSPPVFSSDLFTFWIPENSSPDTRLGHVTVQDMTSSKITFRLDALNNKSSPIPFKIDSTSGLISVSSNVRTSPQLLDRESILSTLLNQRDALAEIRMAVVAVYDSMDKSAISSGLSATVTCIVYVTDINDQKPIFENTILKLNVDEWAPIGQTIVQLKARDLDAAANGSVVYSLAPTTDIDSYYNPMGRGMPFYVDPVSGFIVTNQHLRIGPETYSLIATASDLGNPPLHSSLSLTIRVFRHPTIKTSELETITRSNSSGLANSDQIFFVLETAGVGFVVGSPQLIVLNNSTRNHRFVYDFESSNPNSVPSNIEDFYLSFNSGSLYLTRPLNIDAGQRDLVVRITDQMSILPPRSSLARIKIVVSDVNDHSPQCQGFNGFQTQNGVLFLTMSRDIAVGSVIGRLFCRDLDQGANGSVVLSLLRDSQNDFSGKEDGTIRSQFFIEPLTGLIRVLKNFENHVYIKRVTLEVLASDQCPNKSLRKSTIIPIVVDILPSTNQKQSDLSTNQKRDFESVTQIEDDIIQTLNFSQSTYSVLLPSSAGPGYPIVTLTAYLLPLFSNSSASNVTYRLPQGMFLDLFYINPINGDLSLKRNIVVGKDILDTTPEIQLSAIAEVFSSSQPSLVAITTISISLIHPNRHTPTFISSVDHVTAVEERAMTSLITVTAYDPDLGANGDVRYSIIGGNHSKRLSVDSVSGQISCAPLYFFKDSDNLLSVVIAAVDLKGSSEGKTGSTTVIVQILDTNNNAPLFASSRYSAEIPENSMAGTQIAQVFATDIDADENGQVFYKFTETQTLFVIDPVSGVVSVAGPLDREIQSTYSLIISAHDSSPTQPKSSHVTLTVKVTDVNDHAPHWSVAQPINFVIPSQVASSLPSGTLVGTLKATDSDFGENARLSYSLESDEPRSKQYRIDSLTGCLYTKSDIKVPSGGGLIDRLRVKVQDNGSSSLYTLGVVEVFYLRPSAHMLTITPPSAQFPLREGSTSGSPLGRLSASPNSPSLYFSIVSGNERGEVELDSGTGQLMVAQGRDREKNTDTLSIWVLVTDDQQRAGYSQVSLPIIDIDDNKPTFLQSLHRIQVWEDVVPLSALLHLLLYDPDLGNNAKVRYDVIKAHVTSPRKQVLKTNMFTVDNNGVLTLSRGSSIDYNSMKMIEIVVRATSITSPSASADTKVIIQVLDRINQKPEINLSPNVISINASTHPGTTISSLPSQFSSLSLPLMYDIAPAQQPITASYFPFAISMDSGCITLKESLVLISAPQSQYSLNITVSDGRSLSWALLTINVVYDSDWLARNLPKFVPPIRYLIIDSKTHTGTTIGQLIARAPMPPNNDWLMEYTLLSALDAFSVDSKTGSIATKTILTPHVTIFLTARVSYKGSPSQPMVLGLVQIDVRNFNNEAPVFLYDSQPISMSESAPIGTHITQFVCRDPDGTTVQYKLVHVISTNLHGMAIEDHNTSFSMFLLDPDSGSLVLKSPFDYERVPGYQLQIACMDSGTPQLSSTLQVKLTVSDTNDEYPFFPKSYDFIQFDQDEVMTSSRLPQRLFTFNAHDRDRENVNLVFSLLSVQAVSSSTSLAPAPGSVGEDLGLCFSLDVRSGSLELIRPLPFVARYMLLVKVTDCHGGLSCLGGQSNSNYTRLEIHVLPSRRKNRVPQFATTSLSVSIKENMPPGSVVFYPNAFDSTPVRYVIEAEKDSDKFKLVDDGNYKWSLVTTTALDYETKSFLTVNLQAIDSQGDKSSVEVQIYVIDVDEYVPQFKQNSYSYKIEDGVPQRGQVLLRVSATDGDTGPSGAILFSMRSTHTPHLQVDPISGVIYVAEDFPTSSSSTTSRRRRRSAELSRTEKSRGNSDAESDIETEWKTFQLTVEANSGSLSSHVSVSLTFKVPLVPDESISSSALLIAVLCSLSFILITVLIVLAVCLRKRIIVCHSHSSAKSKASLNHNLMVHSKMMLPNSNSAETRADSSITYTSTYDPVNRPISLSEANRMSPRTKAAVQSMTGYSEPFYRLYPSSQGLPPPEYVPFLSGSNSSYQLPNGGELSGYVLSYPPRESSAYPHFSHTPSQDDAPLHLLSASPPPLPPDPPLGHPDSLPLSGNSTTQADSKNTKKSKKKKKETDSSSKSLLTKKKSNSSLTPTGLMPGTNFGHPDLDPHHYPHYYHQFHGHPNMHHSNSAHDNMHHAMTAHVYPPSSSAVMSMGRHRYEGSNPHPNDYSSWTPTVSSVSSSASPPQGHRGVPLSPKSHKSSPGAGGTNNNLPPPPRCPVPMPPSISGLSLVERGYQNHQGFSHPYEGHSTLAFDHLMGWTPTYRPLTQVFTEIASLGNAPSVSTPSSYGTLPTRGVFPPPPPHPPVPLHGSSSGNDKTEVHAPLRHEAVV